MALTGMINEKTRQGGESERRNGDQSSLPMMPRICNRLRNRL